MPANGMFVDLIPNFDNLENDLENKDLKKEVEVDSDDGGMFGGMGGGQGGGKSGKGMLGGIMQMVTMMGAMLGVVMIIGKAISGLPQIQAIMSMINTVIQLALLPFINMLFTFLKPILVSLIKLMPLWLAFWRNPVGNLMELIQYISANIDTWIAQLPGMIADALAGILPQATEGVKGGIEDIVGNLMRDPLGTLKSGGIGYGLGMLANPIYAPLGALMGLMSNKDNQNTTERNTTVNVKNMSPESLPEQLSKSGNYLNLFGP